MAAEDVAAHARELLDANNFLTLGTVDPDGRPWSSPVYFAAAGLGDSTGARRPTPCIHATSPNAPT
jgi:predicted pyridoxine 5'-phosphate oxidase superfamily flavin-nucleotide-binding protein